MSRYKIYRILWASLASLKLSEKAPMSYVAVRVYSFHSLFHQNESQLHSACDYLNDLGKAFP